MVLSAQIGQGGNTLRSLRDQFNDGIKGLSEVVEQIDRRIMADSLRDSPEPHEYVGKASHGQAGHQSTMGMESKPDEDYVLRQMFTYHSPNPDQQKQYETIRDAALHLALVIVKNTPSGADRKAAIDQLRSAVMRANQGIALRGLSL